MPRKKSTPSVDTPEKVIEQGTYWLPNDARWGGFINIRLDDDQKEAFFAWDADNPSEGTKVLEDVMHEGMKVGLTYDRENQCYICTLIGALVSGSNERYCVTTRAATLQQVVQLTAWKHSQLALGDYGNFRPTTGTMMSWG
jgi:hypothetical protein